MKKSKVLSPPRATIRKGKPSPVTRPVKPAAKAATRSSASRPGGRNGATRGARKGSSRPARPLHPPTPLDEMAGILLIAAGLVILLLAITPTSMGGLAPLGMTLDHWLGSGFAVCAVFVVMLGAEAFTPHQALALPQLLTALGVLLACLEVLADLMGGQGGTVGAWMAGMMRNAVGVPGSWTIALAALLVDLQWITRISLRGPARLTTWPLKVGWRLVRGIGRVARAGWEGYQERRRLAQERREDASASLEMAPAPERKRVEAAAPSFVPPPTAEGMAPAVEPQPDVAEKRRRGRRGTVEEAPVGEAPVFPEYPMPGAEETVEGGEEDAAEEEAPVAEPARTSRKKAAVVDEDDVEIPGYEDAAPPVEDAAPVYDDDAEVPWDEPPIEKPSDETVVEESPYEEAETEFRMGSSPAEQIPLFGPEAFREPVVYELPPLELLAERGESLGGDGAAGDFSRTIVETLNSFGVATRIVNVEKGPTVTRYELQPARGVKVSKITSLNNDIALALAAQSIRIEAPIPGKSAIGIEVPNSRVDAVPLREILESPAFVNGKGLMLALGKDISGRAVVADLLRMPHLLIAGATGSGKSVCLNTVIASILYRATPKEVQMVMVDPKRVELSIFEGIPHLAATHVNPNSRIVKDAKTGTLVLKQACEIMIQRFELLSQSRVRNIAEYNAKASIPMPYLVIIVDELAQLMQISARSVEGYLQELAQMGRAAGIHLILATQRPSVDVLTGTIKSNFPARVAFAVSAQVDSRTILDRGGAEKLLGRGDMLFSPTDSELRRVQGALITLEETERVVDFWRAQESPENLTGLSLEAKTTDDLLAGGQDGGEDEDLLREALRIIKDTRLASASNLQRKLQIGYPRAARLVDELESRGFLGPANGSKPRKILFLESVE